MSKKKLEPSLFDLSKAKRVVSFYPSVDKNGDVVTISTSEDRKEVSYKYLRKAYFAGK